MFSYNKDHNRKFQNFFIVNVTKQNFIETDMVNKTTVFMSIK